MKKVLQIERLFLYFGNGFFYITCPYSAERKIAAGKGFPYHAVVAHRGASSYAPENIL